MKRFKASGKKRMFLLLQTCLVLLLVCAIGLYARPALGAQESAQESEEKDTVAQVPPKQNDWVQIGLVCFMGLATIAYGIFLIRRADDD